MKIGILTFHWASNYGAVLQTYALQSYLQELGHEVFIVNYKPTIYDFNIKNFICQRQFRNLKAYIESRKKENGLVPFRLEKLCLTKRVCCCTEVADIVKDLDLIISGSDQVMNPYFLKDGEGRGRISPTYFLKFPYVGRKVAYAVSFGCKEYPQAQAEIAKGYLRDFEKIGVREKTGIAIAKNLGGHNPVVVPDPTALLKPLAYIDLANQSQFYKKEDYFYLFFIRNIQQRKSVIPSYTGQTECLWNCADSDYTLQTWLKKIYLAKCVITDSFHCVMMCLQLSKPFVVITELPGKDGMNDRLYTLLEPLGLDNRILYKNNIHCLPSIIKSSCDFESVRSKLKELRMKGMAFLSSL